MPCGSHIITGKPELSLPVLVTQLRKLLDSPKAVTPLNTLTILEGESKGEVETKRAQSRRKESENYFELMIRRFPEVVSTFKKDKISKISEKKGKITLVEELDVERLDRKTEE